MPTFLTQKQLFKVMQRELPQDVYPNAAPSTFLSTASVDAKAKVLAGVYANGARLYDNTFPSTADELQVDWEKTVFNAPLDSSFTLAERRDRVVTKLRTRKGITRQDMIDTVLSVIGTDKMVEVIEWGCLTGGWMISESQLSIETYLNGSNLVSLTDVDINCKLVTGELTLPPGEEELARETAFTFEILVYDYVLTAAETEQVNADLIDARPARSQHFIRDGLDSADKLSGDD